MNEEIKQYGELNSLLQDFYETNDWLNETEIDKFINYLSDFCQLKECRCRPNYHEVAHFVMDNWSQDNDELDYFIEALEYIENERRAFLLANSPCSKKNNEVCNLDDFFIKIIDHIRLELYRLNSLADELKKEYAKNEKQQKELNLQIAQFQITLDKVEQNNQKVEKELSNNKFDLIALTTLIFSAFTMLQLNVTIFAACVKEAYSLNLVVLSMAMVNIIVITTIMAIYSVVRKIHGDIDDETLYKNVFLLILVLILSGLLGCKIL